MTNPTSERFSGGTTTATLTASELHIGQVGGTILAVNVTPAITAGLYHANDAVGGKQTITNIMRISGGSGILQRFMLIDKGNQKAPLEVLIFDRDPSVATITDNAAFVFGADIQYFVARLSIATNDYVTVNSIATAVLRNLGIPLIASGSRNLYAACVNLVSPPTYLTVADLIFSYCMLAD